MKGFIEVNRTTEEEIKEDKNITIKDVDLLLWVARNLSLIIDTIGE